MSTQRPKDATAARREIYRNTRFCAFVSLCCMPLEAPADITSFRLMLLAFLTLRPLHVKASRTSLFRIPRPRSRLAQEVSGCSTFKHQEWLRASAPRARRYCVGGTLECFNICGGHARCAVTQPPAACVAAILRLSVKTNGTGLSCAVPHIADPDAVMFADHDVCFGELKTSTFNRVDTRSGNVVEGLIKIPIKRLIRTQAFWIPRRHFGDY